LYEFLLTAFVEVDSSCRGEISYGEFINLIERAAAVPRTFGLDPPDGTVEGRKAIFASMDDTKTGLITFRKFLERTVTHTAGEVEAHKAGKGGSFGFDWQSRQLLSSFVTCCVRRHSESLETTKKMSS